MRMNAVVAGVGMTTFGKHLDQGLKALDGEQLAMLSQRGYLEAIYMVIASMSHLPDLIDRKNARRRRSAAGV